MMPPKKSKAARQSTKAKKDAKKEEEEQSVKHHEEEEEEKEEKKKKKHHEEEEEKEEKKKKRHHTEEEEEKEEKKKKKHHDEEEEKEEKKKKKHRVEEEEEKEKKKKKKEEKEDEVAGSDSDEEQPPKPKWGLEGEIVEGKRKRHVPTTDLKLNEWLVEHLFEKEDVTLNLKEVYETYLDECIEHGDSGVEQVHFYKSVKSKFDKGFTVKESSPYAETLKERKMKKPGTKPKVQADSLRMKMREIIEKSVETLGNPPSGLRFNTIKNYVAANYPALLILDRPLILLKALNRGVYYGHYTCVRGIGKCGFYRLYKEGEVLPPPEEKKKKKKPKKEKKEKKEGDEDEEDAKEGEDTEQQNGEAEGEEGKKDEKKRGRKRASAEEEDTAAKKPKSKKKKQARKLYRKEIIHGDPQRMEDTFPMAMVFMSEPKEASVNRIKKYLENFYNVENLDYRLKQCLQNGLDKGFWSQVSGSGLGSGTFRLEIDEFDPTDDDDVTGMIINAIMASTEPKMCSFGLLKRYLTEFHPDFKVSDRPGLLKRALQRAVTKHLIKQLSGIGANGTFQLVQTFIPSPAILAGEDTASDYEVSDGGESESEIQDERADMALFQDAYKPRPSKRRGKGRQAAAGVDHFTEEYVKKRRAATGTVGRRKVAQANSRRKGKKAKYTEESSEDESSSSEEEEEQSSSEEEANSSDEEAKVNDKSGERYTPRPSKSRGGGASDRGRAAPPEPKGKQKPTTGKKKPAARKGKGRK